MPFPERKDCSVENHRSVIEKSPEVLQGDRIPPLCGSSYKGEKKKKKTTGGGGGYRKSQKLICRIVMSELWR